MKQLVLWLAVIAALIVAGSYAALHVEPASTALNRFVSPGALSSAHADLEDRCSACHEANVGVTVAKCTPCHAADEQLLGRQATAFHASVEECATCHVEHLGTSIRPSRMDHVALARIGARTLERASAHDEDSAATVRSMQTWLRVSGPDDLDADATDRVLDCAGCHDRRDPHLKRFGNDCAQCHETESWVVAGYQHPSPRSHDCVQCHRPPPSHTMMHFSMVSQAVAGKTARVDECYQCHLTTSWNDIAGVGFYKHH